MPIALHDDDHKDQELVSSLTAAVRSGAQFLMRPRAQYWLARLYVTVSVLTTTMFAFFSAAAVQRTVLDTVGEAGWVLISCVCAVSTLGLLDSVVNDVMPERFHIRWTDRHRHQVYMALSLMLASLVWLFAAHGQSLMPALRYSVDSIACLFIAIFDTVARARELAAQASVRRAPQA